MSDANHRMARGRVVVRCRRIVSVRAVTLLEVVLAMGILVFLSSMTYWFYGAALGTRERDMQASQRLQLVRVILGRMADEIRQTSRLSADGQVGLRGEAERLWLATLRVPGKDTAWFYEYGDFAAPAEYDLVKLEYRIARHPDLLHEDGYPEAIGLARVELRTPRPENPAADTGDGDSLVDDFLVTDESGGPRIGTAEEINWDELYSKDVKFLRFCYFDGYRWWDDWDITGENPLPQMVMITMGLEQRPPFDAEFGVRDQEAEEFCTCMNRDPVDCLPLEADQFSVTVRLPQADVFFRSRVNREMKSVLEELGTGGSETDGGKKPGGGSAGGKGSGT